MYAFVTQLDKITINNGNHQNVAFHSKLLDMLRPCISHVNICKIIIVVSNNNNNFPIYYPGCLSTRRRHSQINLKGRSWPFHFYLPSNRCSLGKCAN